MNKLTLMNCRCFGYYVMKRLVKNVNIKPTLKYEHKNIKI